LNFIKIHKDWITDRYTTISTNDDDMNELSIGKKVSEEKNDNNVNEIRTDEKVQTKEKVVVEI
jgi:hypothetical protein